MTFLNLSTTFDSSSEDKLVEVRSFVDEPALFESFFSPILNIAEPTNECPLNS